MKQRSVRKPMDLKISPEIAPSAQASRMRSTQAFVVKLFFNCHDQGILQGSVRCVSSGVETTFHDGASLLSSLRRMTAWVCNASDNPSPIPAPNGEPYTPPEPREAVHHTETGIMRGKE